MKFSSAVPSSQDGDIFPHPKAFEKFIQSQTNSLCSTRLLSHFPLSPTLSLYNKSSREACQSLTKILLFLPCLSACVCVHPASILSSLSLAARAGVSTFTSVSPPPFSLLPFGPFAPAAAFCGASLLSVCLLSSGGQHVQYHSHFSPYLDKTRRDKGKMKSIGSGLSLFSLSSSATQ